MKKLKKKYLDVLENLDWSVIGYTDDGRVEIESSSPARILVHDAEDIEKMLLDLADALATA